MSLTNSKVSVLNGYQVAPWLFAVLADHDNELLAELLDSPYWSLRMGAALELGRRGDRRAKVVLAEGFYDAAPSTRAHIVAALGEIADEEVLKLFVEVLEMAVDESPLVRREVANAMAAIARREKAPSGMWEALAKASDLLVWQALRDDDKQAADAAAIALAAIQGEEAIVMIQEFSDNALEERFKVIDGLLAMKGELGAERIRSELLKVLGEKRGGVALAAIHHFFLRHEVGSTPLLELLAQLGLEHIKSQVLPHPVRGEGSSRLRFSPIPLWQA